MGFIGWLANIINSGAARVLALRAVTAGAIVGDALNLDFLRREAIKLAPGATAEDVRAVADFAGRALGIGPDKTLWVTRRGQPCNPKYLVIRLAQGDMYLTDTLISMKAKRALQRRGSGRGFFRGQRSIATISQAQGR